MPTPTWEADPISPDHVARAAAICRDTLHPARDADWSIPAGPLVWTCRDTLDHISDALGYYCGQLATRAPANRPRFRNGDLGSTIPNLFEAVTTGAAMLGAIASASPPDVRAWHRMGPSDPAGFLAMACEEILVHTWDISQGFDLPMTVPDDLARATVHRLFPWAPTGCTAWEAQLWCSDRIALADRGKIGAWGWHGAPLADWDGQMIPAVTFPVDA